MSQSVEELNNKSFVMAIEFTFSFLFSAYLILQISGRCNVIVSESDLHLKKRTVDTKKFPTR